MAEAMGKTLGSSAAAGTAKPLTADLSQCPGWAAEAGFLWIPEARASLFCSLPHPDRGKPGPDLCLDAVRRQLRDQEAKQVVCALS